MNGLTLDRTVNTVRETFHVSPSRPMKLDEQGGTYGVQTGGTRLPKPLEDFDVETLLDVWRNNALRVAEEAGALAEKHPNSPTAWTRSAYAHFIVGLNEEADIHANKAIETAKIQLQEMGVIDVPAVVGALRVLSARMSAMDLLTLLEGVPEDSYILGVKVSLMASLGEIEKAFEMAERMPRPDASGLLGYLWLQKNDPQRAIHNLRTAISYNEHDIDSHFNLAIALRNCGSLRKALRSAGIAHHLSPGRLDLRNLYFELLAATNNWNVLRHEVKTLRENQSQETPEMLIAEARVSFATGNQDHALSFLERAEKCARDNGELKLAAELHGNLTMIKHASGKLSRKIARADVLSALGSAPESVVLADMLSMLITRHSEFRILEPYLARHQESQLAAAYSLRTRSAYLRNQFDEYLVEVRKWAAAYPNDLDGTLFWISAEGYVGDDWSRSAEIAKRALRRLPQTRHLVNLAAYSLALSGQAEPANKVLDLAKEWDFKLQATRGLVSICLGDLKRGLKEYLKAQEMVEKTQDSVEDSILMSIHQGLLLRRLNLIKSENEPLLKAASLSTMTLPNDWKDMPAFLVLKLDADRNGWDWPPLPY